MTQAEFARRTGLAKSTISNIVRGIKAPRWRRGEQWCKILGIEGSEREEFLDALHIAASSPRIPSIVSRLERERWAR